MGPIRVESITLNPQLVKAPSQCVDYVIAHELCHLQELNDSQVFYALQEQLYPAWREAKTHLKAGGHIYLYHSLHGLSHPARTSC